jgi:hypothetical protein
MKGTPQTHEYQLFSRRGEWLGVVHNAESALDAKRQWVEAFGRFLGYGLRQIKVERSA